MKKLTLLLITSLTLLNCSKEEPQTSTPTPVVLCPTNTQDLPIISDGNNCEPDSNPFICEILEIEEPKFLDEAAFAWSPGICDVSIGDEISFSYLQEKTAFRVIDAGHYIADERIYVSCNYDYELPTYICQKNEVIYVKYLNSVLGPDTMIVQLNTLTRSYEDQTPGEKFDIYNFWQQIGNSNSAHFWINHTVGSEYYEQTWESYHEELSLNGVSYKNVIRYQYGDNILSVPDHKYYVQQGIGIIGFEVDNKLWIRD